MLKFLGGSINLTSAFYQIWLISEIYAHPWCNVGVAWLSIRVLEVKTSGSVDRFLCNNFTFKRTIEKDGEQGQQNCRRRSNYNSTYV
jgi:hypothetical protein